MFGDLTELCLCMTSHKFCPFLTPLMPWNYKKAHFPFSLPDVILEWPYRHLWTVLTDEKCADVDDCAEADWELDWANDEWSTCFSRLAMFCHSWHSCETSELKAFFSSSLWWSWANCCLMDSWRSAEYMSAWPETDVSLMFWFWLAFSSSNHAAFPAKIERKEEEKE